MTPVDVQAISGAALDEVHLLVFAVVAVGFVVAFVGAALVVVLAGVRHG